MLHIGCPCDPGSRCNIKCYNVQYTRDTTASIKTNQFNQTTKMLLYLISNKFFFKKALRLFLHFVCSPCCHRWNKLCLIVCPYIDPIFVVHCFCIFFLLSRMVPLTTKYKKQMNFFHHYILLYLFWSTSKQIMLISTTNTFCIIFFFSFS